MTYIRRAAAYRELGDYASSLADAEQAINLTDKNAPDNLNDTFAAAQREKGLALYCLGRPQEAISWLENSLHLFSFLKEPNAIPALEMELGMAHRAQGNHDAALKLYHSALETWRATGNLGWQATLLNNMGVLYHFRGDYKKAFEALENALECAKQSGYLRAQALALSSLGDLLIDLQEISRSDECFDQALMIASQLRDTYLILYASVAKARIARLGMNFAQAETILLDAFNRLENQASPGEEALFRLEYGSLLLFSDREVQAVVEFSRAVYLYERIGHTPEICVSRLWLASALIGAKQEAAGVVQLGELSSASTSLREMSFLYVNAIQVRAWIEKIDLPENNIAVFIEQLMTDAERFRKSLPVVRRKLRQISHIVSISPPHLTIQAFGPTQVTCDGKIIMLSDWQTRETRDLFFFLLQSKPATKEEIASVFWPDISPTRLKMRFKTTIYRLRHALRQETILFDNEYYQFNRGIDYEYDLEKFEEYIEQANAGKNRAETILWLKSAIDIVKGPYLADVDMEWASRDRIRLGDLYHAALIKLGGLYLEENEANKTLEVCQTALKVDPLIEEAYRLSMRAYAALGDRAGVVRQFKACTENFVNELGIQPSKETQELYRQLI